MVRTIVWVVALVAVLAGGWWLYTQSSTRSVSGTGDIFTHNAGSDTREQLDIDGNPVKDDASAPPATISAPAPQAIAAVAIPTLQPAAMTKPAATGVPVADSIDRQPPSGMAFGGAGKYQWYRQGDLTWRIDTHSGSTCIDFATMDEWTKPIVYTNGCRNRG